MELEHLHLKKIEQLQEQVRAIFMQRRGQESPETIALRYPSGHSNTTRSKSYKATSRQLDFGSLNQVIQIDPQKRLAVVEPRVTMEALVKTTLPYGLIPYVVPEFKGITVGGAIMGGAAESSSHRWGTFNDGCSAFMILCGDGSLLQASPQENPDLFYGIAGSYGSIGALVSATIELQPAKEFVHVRYRLFSNPQEAIGYLQTLSHGTPAPEFIDGIVFSKDLAVVIEGTLQTKENIAHLPRFSLQSVCSRWYYQHVQNIALEAHLDRYEEAMPFQEYLFRYDQGAFWMGAYLLRPPLLARFIGQGILKLWKAEEEQFSEEEIGKLHRITHPNAFWRFFLRPVMTSQRLWSLLHRAEKWVQERVIIQDFCIPEDKASSFLGEVLDDPGTYPMWLCPIKGTRSPQIFSPHLISKRSMHKSAFNGENPLGEGLSEENPADGFINIGIYGLPSYYASIEQITRKLEQKTKAYGGRKVLYSRSHYTHEEFWQIYFREAYEALRAKTQAKGIWHEITDKVLSV